MLHNEINKHIAAAMKSRDADRLYVLKMIKAKFLEFQTSKGFDEAQFNDAKEISIIQKMEKSWKEEAELFDKAGRDTSELKARLAILSDYLPKEPELNDIIDMVKDSGIEPQMKNMRAILAHVQAQCPAATGKLVSEALKQLQ
jgi:uncharacterized protein YqeY